MFFISMKRGEFMALSEIHKLRLKFGDLDEDCPFLTDEEYQDFIDSYPSEKKLHKAIDIALLSILSYSVRERSGQEERYANQAFEQRLALTKLKWKDPKFNGNEATPIFGGVDRNEMADIANNPSLVPDTFYKGQWEGRGEWQGQRHYHYVGEATEPNTVCRMYPLWLLNHQ